MSGLGLAAARRRVKKRSSDFDSMNNQATTKFRYKGSKGLPSGTKFYDDGQGTSGTVLPDKNKKRGRRRDKGGSGQGGFI